ncbi:PREDICTED: probable pectinesterase 15 [Fragaria vesca subsp. vesca]|uniref:probable pectinesterase 15 n=1 Tax=Fragaria vesca subsp. vesca TaxID=101020 RepID=UPI0002C33469|nr:PREDICTED: probable pectinesterase 15 [Fragaria vesca subsp. vesca]
MCLKTTCLTCFVALLVALLAVLFASAHLTTNQNSPSALSIPYAAHHKHENDDPLPDTTATSYLCVDQNGHLRKWRFRLANKPNITFQGEGYLWTVIAWNDTAKSSYSTKLSASVHVAGANFIAKNISFKNTAPPPEPGVDDAQAVALRVSGDKAAFWGCGFYGYQDTLNDENGRHYFKDCYIQGTVDYIYGNGQSFYENCQLITIAAAGSIAYITAHGRSNTVRVENTCAGFAFVSCTIDGSGIVWLGRECRRFARVVFANTYMSNIITPEGWNATTSGDEKTVFFGEYKCKSPGANMNKRKPFVHNLTHSQAYSHFLTVSFIDGVECLSGCYPLIISLLSFTLSLASYVM